MDSTFFGDAIEAELARIAARRQIDTDRGIDGRVSAHA
jgi:hypothetical protein